MCETYILFTTYCSVSAETETLTKDNHTVFIDWKPQHTKTVKYPLSDKDFIQDFINISARHFVDTDNNNNLFKKWQRHQNCYFLKKSRLGVVVLDS